MDNTNEMNPDLEKEESSLEKNEESSLDETKELSQDEAEELSQDETEELFFDENEDTFLDKVWKALHNQTFLYIVRRILSSLFTALLISAVISILISFVPDTKFYNVGTLNKLMGSIRTQSINANLKAGKTMEEAIIIAEKAAQNTGTQWINAKLYQYGRVTMDGERIPVIQNILKYIYWLLPIPKEIPITWAADGTILDSWTGWCYFGRTDSGKYVTDILKEKMGISFKITMITILFTYLISYPLGIAMSRKPGGLLDKIGNAFIVLNYAIPALVFYLFMKTILGKKDGIFGFLDMGLMYDPENWKTLIPPIFCMIFLSIPGQIIWLRRFMIDELSSDYVKFARSKGLSENRILYTHVLRNAAVPLIRNIPAVFIGAIMGSYYVEAIWNIPGTGGTLITGVQNFEMAIIQGLTIIYALLGMLSFLLGDIITIFFDPRIKLSE